MAIGDPRNLAYILHWDGFQSFDGKNNHNHLSLQLENDLLNGSTL